MPDIVHLCYPGVGGQAAVATGLAIEGSRAGVSHGVVFYGIEATAPQYLQLCEAHDIEHMTIVKQPGFGLSARRQLAQTIRSMAPSIVVSHHHDTAVTVSALTLLDCSDDRPLRIFVEHHSNALKSKKDWLLSTLAHRSCDQTVFLTEAYRREVHAKIGRWLDFEKTTVIANGLDLSFYQPVDHGCDTSVIGMQGRMDTGKDFESLIRAFAIIAKGHQSLRLELIGDGPHRDRLEKLCRDLSIEARVNFTGFLKHEELIAHMSEWQIAVLMTAGETLSMAILEIWALALPLVSTRVAGVQDLVNDGVDALLVNPADVAALGETLLKLIQESDLAKSLGLAGRDRVLVEFNRQQIWQQYVELSSRVAPRLSHHLSTCVHDSRIS